MNNKFMEMLRKLDSLQSGFEGYYFYSKGDFVYSATFTPPKKCEYCLHYNAQGKYKALCVVFRNSQGIPYYLSKFRMYDNGVKTVIYLYPRPIYRQFYRAVMAFCYPMANTSIEVLDKVEVLSNGERLDNGTIKLIVDNTFYALRLFEQVDLDFDTTISY